MRRVVIVLLSLVEGAVGCGIFVESVELSHAVAKNAAVGRVASVVLRSTQRIAVKMRVEFERLG